MHLENERYDLSGHCEARVETAGVFGNFGVFMGTDLMEGKKNPVILKKHPYPVIYGVLEARPLLFK